MKKNTFFNSSNSIVEKSLINQNNSSKRQLKKSLRNTLKLNNDNKIISNNNENNLNSKKKEPIKNERISKEDRPSLNDQELNTLDYDKALILDKRTYFQYYCSLLKKKHLILFTFLPINDYNILYIKIILFLLSFSLYFTINGFFFTDDTMHQIYKNSGKINYFNQIASIIYSSIIPAIINIILKQLSLSENDILKLKKEKDKKILKIAKDIEKCLKIKFIIFFIICYMLLFFFWYFISCFCGVYKNTQIILIIDTLISFVISMIYPFGLNLLPGIFRIAALKSKNKDKKCLYRFGSIVSLI